MTINGTGRVLLVQAETNFKITIPDDAKVTFGPFSPPTKGLPYNEDRARGTLRVYQGSRDNIIACFTGVCGFRELSLDYSEQVVVEEGAVIWKSDHRGYQREDKMQREERWLVEDKLMPEKPKRGRK